ncbi:efflux RND transporter permease subunit, partial [candidate division KSB1 bacterium]
MLLTKIAINRPVLTAMVFTACILLGVISWTKLPVELVPNLTFPSLSVQAFMPGASPEKVENDLIIPIESEIAKMSDIERISSIVRNGGGTVNIEFKIGVNMKYVALKLDQKVNQLSSTLPVGSRAYVGRNFDTEMISNFLMELSIRGEDDLDVLRRVAEEKILPELEKVDGISNVNVGGGQLREVLIKVDENKAREYEINLVTIISKINDFNREKEFLGQITHNNNISFVTLSGQVTHLTELESLIIQPAVPLKLKDIAEIQFSKEEPTQYYRINGMQTVGMFLLKDNESNLIRTAE